MVSELPAGMHSVETTHACVRLVAAPATLPGREWPGGPGRDILSDAGNGA